MPKPSITDLPETQVQPDPSLEKRTRRTFTAEYKLKIIEAADQCARGELGALLRRENLYSNQLQQWLRNLRHLASMGYPKVRQGQREKHTAAEREVIRLRKENARLARKLEIANGCLDLQKKALAMLDHVQTGNEG